jgi:nitroimidazol reductase NimA-like FMN-containing flavoprotein (pyridoxamine 5'-phosphate oxidase superfamily)
MPKLSDAEFEEFLDERGILMRLGVVRADGTPLVVPIWFIHEDGAIYFTPRERSEWFGCLRENPRVSLCIDEQPHPYRKVLIEGAAELVHDLGEDEAWRDLYLRMARRYTPADQAEAYVQNTIAEPRGLYRIELAGADRIRSWRMPVEGEPAMGIWASRYYRDETRF